VDSWLAILALATYKIAWESVKQEGVAVYVDPVPQAPFFSFVIATVISLCLGEFAIHCHKAAVKVSKVGDDDLSDRSWATMPARGAPNGSHALFFSRYVVGFGLIISFVLVFGSCFLATFELSVTGLLVSLIIDNDAPPRSFSLYSLGVSIADKKLDADMGLVTVQFIFFVFTLVIPLVVLGGLLTLWTIPMGQSTQRTLFAALRVLDAWASFDVFVLAVFVCHLEFGLVAEFLQYHDNVAVLCTWMRDRLDGNCFQVTCNLTVYFLVMAAAAIVSNVATKVALRICEVVFEGADPDDERNLHCVVCKAVAFDSSESEDSDGYSRSTTDGFSSAER